MKNTIYISSLALVVSCFNTAAFAQAHAEDFKVQLKQENAAKPQKTAQVEHKATHDEAPAKPVKKTVSGKTPSSYNREISTIDGKTTYTVTGRAPHLYMVSRDLYGNEKQWKAIADWNSLKEPYTLQQGQQLVIKKSPTISAEEADAILIKNYTKLNRMETVAGIQAASEKHQEKEMAKEEPAHEEASTPVAAAAVNAAAATAAVSTPKPAEEASLPTPTSVDPHAAKTEAPAAEPEPAYQVPVEQPKPKEEKTHGHSNWSFKTSLAASKFSLQEKANDGSSDITLHSDIDYGVELEVAYHLSEKTEFLIGAAVEKMDIHPDENVGEIEGEAQWLAKYTLGVEYEMTPVTTLAALVNYEQTPFVEPTVGGAEVKSIFIPQIQLGARWNFVNTGKFKMALITDGVISMATNHDGLDLKSGGGYYAGLKFSNEFTKRTLTYGVAYRDIYQDTEENKNTLKTWYANIGLIW
ncbi:hypothetical protein B9G69_009300 [Bdellovibrio sp. SKB1291214]|uniref:hypothetical protein n=1 Tax=Bdellovibrio sp. SKB1291214 TaxID=1732569 RepID=UPI000B515431|nr:hypothetical protein [Bdellovibrio sp. SKB1291214]UYL07242.1 hypothetical protein B9G69_009300 [Bdellovibrio sp. SKB1291214]